VRMSEVVSSSRKRSAEVGAGKCTSAAEVGAGKCTSAAVMVTNEYSGYEPPAGIHHLTDRLSPTVAPEEFYTQYVEKRRPAVFAGLLVDDQWKGSQWTLPYLCHKAGTTTVTVEDRPKPTDSVADMSGRFQEMQYRDFISSLVEGDTRYQLTDIDVQCSMSDLRDRNGFLTTVLQPLQTLADDFPLRPTILGNLIPHQVWIKIIVIK